MSYLRDRAVVLKKEPFREHDARVTLYGQTLGKMSAVARGSERWEAKQLGHLEPFSEVEMLIAKGAAFDKLAVARVVSPRPRLRVHLGSIAIAGAFFDVVDRLTRPGIVDEDLYRLLTDVLDLADVSDAQPSSERGRLLFAAACLKSLDILGFAPQLGQCLRCLKHVEEPAWFLASEGGLACAACVREVRRELPQAITLPPHALRLLRLLRARPFPEILRVTAGADLFACVSSLVESSLHHAPLIAEVHGARTVAVLLG